MKRVEALWQNRIYRHYYQILQEDEQARVFCCHDMQHFLDVARIAYILSMEQHMGIAKEVIYAAALLHDLGRVKEYDRGIPHAMAGVAIANEILAALPEEAEFTETEKEAIVVAIATHQEETGAKEASLARVLQKADRLSRPCYLCRVRSQCKWPKEKMNTTIVE
ncbi:MAG: HD domain-containing protein [Megasphaera sp.]|jgi:putative nucleotidyltransferase with HDIG domain|nr:HD domain-containing protein [Megasphaera sp.]MCH4187373.1 HD domain-containing protein [Megasphaera sp.]MCH4217555.1 HD domain-containing protein [Megasphaera sp.]